MTIRNHTTLEVCCATSCWRPACVAMTNGQYRHNIGLTEAGARALAATNAVRLCSDCFAEATR